MYRDSVITHISQLKDHELGLNDRIIFTLHSGGKVEYRVVHSHLANLTDTPNDYILEKIGYKNNDDKRSFCKKCYGYEPRGGIFPEFSAYDFKAAKNVVKAIFKELGQKEEFFPESLFEM